RSHIPKCNMTAVAARRNDGRFIDKIGNVGTRNQSSLRQYDQDRVSDPGQFASHAPLKFPDVLFDLDGRRALYDQTGRLEARPDREFLAGWWGQAIRPGRRVETVELGEELIERLLLFVEAADSACLARAAKGVEFIDENNAGGCFARLLEKITNTRGANADEHFDELGTGYRKERDAGFTRDRAGKQGLASS